MTPFSFPYCPSYVSANPIIGFKLQLSRSESAEGGRTGAIRFAHRARRSLGLAVTPPFARLRGFTPRARKGKGFARLGGVPNLPAPTARAFGLCRSGDPPPPNRPCACYPQSRRQQGCITSMQPKLKGRQHHDDHENIDQGGVASGNGF